MKEIEEKFSLEDILALLRAAGEETRLRILALLKEGELSVSDLTEILAQSQPRISRHLKLLVEAGLVQRQREGAWAFFRLADKPKARSASSFLIGCLDHNDRLFAADLTRLSDARRRRAKAAEDYFSSHAEQWDRLRSLHAPEADVDEAILAILQNRPIRDLIDLGTGTGRMLQLLAPLSQRMVGLDASSAMLSVARANLEKAGIKADLRQGDIHAPPFERGSFDLVLMHQVLHYLDDPAKALREAAAMVSVGGRLLVVDFAPHDLEFLREAQAHRRLGFRPEQVDEWLREAGLEPVKAVDLAPLAKTGDRLTVILWLAQDRRIRSDRLLRDDNPTNKDIA